MPIKVLIALLALIAAPLLLLGWVSSSTMRTDRAAAQRQIESVFRGRLRDIDRSLLAIFDDNAKRLADHLTIILADPDVDFSTTVTRLSNLERTNPQVRQVVVVNPQGRVAYPPPPSNDSDVQRFEDYAAITSLVASRPRSIESLFENELVPLIQEKVVDGINWLPKDQAIFPIITHSNNPLRSLAGLPVNKLVYHVWYRDEGTQLSLWATGADRAAVGVLLERSRWISDLTIALPDTKLAVVNSSKSSYFRNGNSQTSDDFEDSTDATVLVDESNRVIYRWGSDFDLSDSPIAQHDLSGPLTSWRLRYYTATPVVAPLHFTSLYATVASLGVVLFFLGAYVLTHLQRQIRLAQHRVTFAGQVSHELRTPLTNIRLFTELALHDLGDNACTNIQRVANRLSIIDSETRRLSRIVSGVMEVIREDQGVRPLRMVPQNLDCLIDDVLTHFTPSYSAAGIDIERVANANAVAGIDADCLEMILVNLLSNVEKYAAAGGHIRIESYLDSSTLKARRHSRIMWFLNMLRRKSHAENGADTPRRGKEASNIESTPTGQPSLQAEPKLFQEANLVVLISDRGPGIPLRYRHAIFKPFRRLDDSVSAPSGTGIGLTIARRVARRHGGDVTLVPTSQGACFKVEVQVIASGLIPATPAGSDS